jgi:hypothetical protein
MAGLRLDSGGALLKGSHNGAVVVPGKAQASKLIERVVSTKKGFAMPPTGQPLTAQEVATLRAWIDAGAKVSAEMNPPAAAAAATPQRNSHWAFNPVVKPEPPAVQQRSWVRNPIDAFILARLEREGILPSPEASRTKLARRVSLDLTGLPPTPEQLQGYLQDNRPDAYEHFVDSLLDSPHYGERWARQWLDLARYADSDGFEKDLVRPYAWRYRQWVINALNQDMPFDQFSIEQLAGDLLPNPTVEQRVATGFHRNVLTNREAGVDRAEARFEQDVNRVNTISTVWMGLTAGCAQCHNHKFDPISQREYYSLMAYVANVEEHDIHAPLPGEMGPYLQAKPDYDKERDEILAEYDVLKWQHEFEEKVRNSIANPGTDVEWDFMVTEVKAGLDNAVKLLNIPMEKRNQRQSALLTTHFLRRLGPDIKRDKALTDRLNEAKEKLQKLEAGLPKLTEAMTVIENGNPPRCNVAVGGDYRNKGAEVEPGAPAVLGGQQPKTRLEFARWLFRPENSLTARVAVNRMWQEFFGRGLVLTSEDFGTQGDKPTHPELLDWLAAEFRERGWSMKAMHRLIVTSASYRQDSKVRKELLERDPANTLVARQSRLRLPAETIRDSALAVSGLLNTSLGGPSVRPPQPKGVAELGYGNNVKWPESTGPDRYRRGLYIHYQRTTPYPMLSSFDAPDSTVACSRRARSNTPLQALNLLNDPVYVEAAQAFAVRLLQQPAASPGERLDAAFQLSLARKPTASERDRLLRYLDEQRSILAQEADAASKLLPVTPEGVANDDAAAWAGVARILLNLDEFITKE